MWYTILTLGLIVSIIVHTFVPHFFTTPQTIINDIKF